MTIAKWAGIVVLIILALLALVAAIGASLPVSHTVTRTATFKATPEQLFTIISGPPSWRPDVLHYEKGPEYVGRRMWTEFGKGGSKMTYEVVEFDPPRKLVIRIADPHLPFGGTWTYLIEPAGDGSCLTITENGEVYNPIFRFVSRYIMGESATTDRYLQALSAYVRSTVTH